MILPRKFLLTYIGVTLLFFKDFNYLFLERGEGREKERERNINVWLPLACPQPGTWPATQACALTGNQTGNILVHRLALNPLNHTSQGYFFFLRTNKISSLVGAVFKDFSF